MTYELPKPTHLGNEKDDTEIYGYTPSHMREAYAAGLQRLSVAKKQMVQPARKS